MEAFHVVTGLPRSGSTLLCDLLNQRPDTFASSTSALAQTLATMAGVLTQSAEVTSDLIAQDDAIERHHRVLRSVVGAWHPEARTIFDKSRLWSRNSPLLRAIAPQAVLLVTVRDLRDVFASVERAHFRTGLYGTGTQGERAKAMMAPDGLIGSTIMGVEDLIRRRPGRVMMIPYGSLVTSPQEVMDKVAEGIGEDQHVHDIEAVASSASDVDALYRFKFDHRYQGTRPVKSPEHTWADVLGADVAKMILEAWPLYSETFGYK